MEPVPDGWEVNAPAFVGVASGKAGTSWWYKMLIEHPSVKQNRLDRKELSYFYHFGYNGINSEAIHTYRKAFAAPKDCISGEWSPGYLNFPLAIDYIAKAVPETKILALVRNPVDRVLSAQNQKLSVQAKILKIQKERLYFYKTYSVFQVAIYNSYLYKPFKRLLKFFDKSQILVLQYEKCRLNTSEELAKTYQFLGVDDTFTPPSLNKNVNKKTYVLPKLSPEARTLLAEHFHKDVIAFNKLFPEIDLSYWEEFQK